MLEMFVIRYTSTWSEEFYKQQSSLVYKEQQVNINFHLTQINSWYISYNQYIQNKIKNKLCIKAINYACFKLEEKITRDVKKNKSNFYRDYRR